METTKNRICRLAKVLFNERGYDDVSLRDIAEAAGMTVGNLSYHFPKKDMLILTIRENTYNDVDNFLDNIRASEDYSLSGLLRLWEMTALTHRECGF